jgi:hypothetical protein
VPATTSAEYTSDAFAVFSADDYSKFITDRLAARVKELDVVIAPKEVI